MRHVAAVRLAVMLSLGSAAAASPYANLVSYSAGTVGWDPGDAYPGYTDPTAALGAPATMTSDGAGGQTAVTMMFPAWPAGQVLMIGAGGSLTVGFDHQVQNNPGNPYGIAFQIFTNALFNGDPATGYTTILDGSMYGPTIGQISVSQDGTTWYTVDPTKLGPAFPTQAYLSDPPATGAALSNFTTPVNPGLNMSSFTGLTVAGAIALYGGSAGGLGINLNDLLDANGDPTSLPWIQFVQIDGSTDGVTGFADTSVPEPATLRLAAIALAGLLARRRKGQ